MVIKVRYARNKTFNVGLYFRDRWGRFNPHFALLKFKDRKLVYMFTAFCRKPKTQSARIVSMHVTQ